MLVFNEVCFSKHHIKIRELLFNAEVLDDL
jgi:hypothetical protein